jgi:hypothetical protein
VDHLGEILMVQAVVDVEVDHKDDNLQIDQFKN